MLRYAALAAGLVLAVPGLACSQAERDEPVTRDADTVQRAASAPGADTAPPSPISDMVRLLESPHSVATTLDRVEQIVTGAGARVFARIDHAEGAARTGASLPATQLLIFGNPQIGTPLIERERLVGLELPVRMLAFEENGQVYLAYTTADEIARRTGLDRESDAVQRLAGALEQISTRAVSDETLGEE